MWVPLTGISCGKTRLEGSRQEKPPSVAQIDDHKTHVSAKPYAYAASPLYTLNLEAGSIERQLAVGYCTGWVEACSSLRLGMGWRFHPTVASEGATVREEMVGGERRSLKVMPRSCSTRFNFGVLLHPWRVHRY